MRARVAVILAGVLLAGCGGRNPTDTDAESLPNRPLDAYARQGLITGQEDFPVVGGFATVAGPGDSTWLLFGASLPARALRFHRAEDGFAAGYSVRLRLSRDGVERARSDRGEQVRVATFEETGRTDESLVYQDYLLVEPGTYVVDVAIHDSIGTRALVRTDTIDVPLYRDGDAAIVLVHEAAFRSGDRTQPPRLILNSRRAIAYGDGEARVYVELYGTTADAELVVLDESGARVFASSPWTWRKTAAKTD